MRVAVIGASGGMGSLFVRYFLSRGCTVTGSDTITTTTKTKKKTDRKEEGEGEGRRDVLPGYRFLGTNSEAVEGAEVVLVATPVETTARVVEEVAEKIAPGAILVEISSVKRSVLPPVRKALAGRPVRLLSVHPLFGPSLSSYQGMRVCVIETGSGEVALARTLFPEAALIPMGEEEHDRTMAVVLSLTHLLNMAYAGVVSRYLKPGEFREVQTPTSGVQLTLAEGILSQNPTLYSYIQMENENSSEVVAALIDELTQMLRYIEEKDYLSFESRFRELSRKYSRDSKDALDLVYQAFEKGGKTNGKER